MNALSKDYGNVMKVIENFQDEQKKLDAEKESTDLTDGLSLSITDFDSVLSYLESLRYLFPLYQKKLSNGRKLKQSGSRAYR